MHIVYGLEDQRNEEIFYVGVTDDVFARFLQHLRCDASNSMKDARIQEMREAGYLPFMRTLQLVADPEQARQREGYWTRHYYDLGAPLTNQIIPMVQTNVIIVREMVEREQEQGPKLKARMTLDEQREYVLHLLDQGVPRRRVLAKVDGYIHPDVANSIIDENIVSPLTTSVDAIAIVAIDAVPVTGVENGMRQPLDGAHATHSERTADYPLLDRVQIEIFATAYELTGNIDESLKRAGVNTRYREHARVIIRERGLRRA